MTCRLQWYIKASWMLDTTSPTADRVTRYVLSKHSFLLACQRKLTIWNIKWVLFNDDRVTVASEAEVLNADAYLLFYNLRTLATATTESWTVIVEISVWRGRSFVFSFLSFLIFWYHWSRARRLFQISHIWSVSCFTNRPGVYMEKWKKGELYVETFFVPNVCCIVRDRGQG